MANAHLTDIFFYVMSERSNHFLTGEFADKEKSK
jgi:hypothetical protein